MKIGVAKTCAAMALVLLGAGLAMGARRISRPNNAEFRNFAAFVYDELVADIAADPTSSEWDCIRTWLLLKGQEYDDANASDVGNWLAIDLYPDGNYASSDEDVRAHGRWHDEVAAGNPAAEEVKR